MSITDWLARPFENAVWHYKVMWFWQSTTADDEHYLRAYVARRHPLWHARWRLAGWLRKSVPACRDVAVDTLALAYLACALIYIAGEVALHWIARTVRRDY
jgi:hypothetical protein